MAVPDWSLELVSGMGCAGGYVTKKSNLNGSGVMRAHYIQRTIVEI